MGSMADVIYPLVTANHGEVYPTMLWCLGLIIVAGGSSVAADIEQAIQKADASAAHPVPAAAPEGA